MSEIRTLAEGKFLGLYVDGTWEYAKRPNSTACIAILPILGNGDIVLIEQFRVPTQKNVIEIPAGLVGDEEAFKDESLAETAGRELIEETGYKADTITPLIGSPTSAGMTPEITHIFAGTNLTKVSEGGGVAGENITTHIVPFTELSTFLSEKENAGCLIDFKIHAALWLASQQGLL